MNPKIEFRTTKPEKFAIEYRGEKKDVAMLVGYAARFNSESEVLGHNPAPWREMLMPGCFTRCLSQNPDIRALYAHDTSLVIGRMKAGTLNLSQDDYGLRFEISLPNTTVARDLTENINLGNIDGMSFSFAPNYDSIVWEKRDGYNLRMIREINLFEEISVVAFPAYPAATVEAREKLEVRELPDFQRFLAQQTAQDSQPISQLLRRRLEIQQTINKYV